MSDIVVIGGGVVGLACAYELTNAGASVTLLEYGKTGMQATNAAAGMLAPIIESHGPGPMLDIGTRALRAYPALVEELEQECGVEVELRLHGIVRVATSEEDAAALRRRFACQREIGLPLDWLDGPACRDLEPRLTHAVLGGVFSAGEGSVSNQLLALALERAAIARGADVRQRTPVTGFARRNGRVTAVRSGEESFPGDTIVLAAGARSGQLARKLRAHVPVRPIRGQMLALGGMSTPIRHIVWGSGGYLVPRANGLVFAGATVEDVGFRRRTTKAAMRRLRAMASRLVPQLAAAKVHFGWAGLRPGTPDDMPIIGQLTEPDNVVAATGHYRNGILLGPITGKLVARGIVDGDWSGVPAVFFPARFD